MDRGNLDGAGGAPGTVDPNDWNQHWLDFSVSVEDNPAQAFRRRLVDRMLGPVPRGAHVLDIGSGTGDLALYLTRRHPGSDFLGVELSATGVEASRRKVPGATFVQRDLCVPEPTPTPYMGWATHAVCSEVLEHVDDPELLLRNAVRYCAPGCRLVITVPGGPMSKLDHHIGHRQHYTPAKLSSLLRSVDLSVEEVGGRGFPIFNLYRLAIVARGQRLVADVGRGANGAAPSGAARLAMRAFQGLLSLPSPVPFGWQIVGIARVRQ